MTRKPTALVLHDRVPAGAVPEQADVLVQADAVTASLARLGYGCRRLDVDPGLATLADELETTRPQLVFNLVESVGGSGEHIHAVPALLERLGLPFTGAPADAMRRTTDKIAAKRELRAHGIATPDWWTGDGLASDPHSRWIVKSAWEDASHGLDDDSVVVGTDAAHRRLAASRSQSGGEWFAERFVEGREFNVSLLAGPEEPAVLPPAEIEFRDYPADKPRMVGYRAKWQEASFEYRNTVRRFIDEREDRRLAVMLRSLARRCWDLCGLRGYARVDFRVDAAGLPWVLEVNANPCLSPDAGFRAALAEAGISFDDAIARIIADSTHRPSYNSGGIHKRAAPDATLKNMNKIRAWSATSETSPLAPATIERRTPTPTDVQIEILYCGVCHSDVHQSRNEWRESFPTTYPCVPGHEIVGRVTKVGAAVKKFRAGSLAAVGCMVDSCGECHECRAGLEQFCVKFPTLTYNSPDPHTGGHTFGGYSQSIVVDERFTLRVPENLDPAGVAPLLCAGITTYSPLRHWQVARGMKVGVVGLGGLGHMALKFAHALGAQVVLFTTSPGKAEDARRLGADEVVISKNAAEMAAHAGSCDFILDAVSAQHDINAYLKLLKRDGKLVLVGAPEKPLSFSSFNLLFGRKTLAGSIIGGIAETQEMLDFCGKYKITSDIELIPIQKVNEAYERLLRSDVKYRFVIDMASLK